jgi:G3E family GTPase
MKSINHLCELRDWLKGRLSLRRSERRFDSAFDLDVASDIAADAARQQAQIAAEAYSAEQSDIEAAKLIEIAKRDGLDASDLPAIERALRHIRSSAKHDHNISETARI